MNAHRRSRLRLVGAVCLFPLLFACGSDEGTADTTTSSTTTVTTEATTTSVSMSVSTSTSESTTTAETTSTSEPNTTDEPTTSSTTTTSTTTTSVSTTGSSTTPATRVVAVYFSTGDGTDCSEVTAYERTVDASIGPARAAFEELLGGPTAAEEAAGASSFFSSTTADAVRSVSLTAGVLTVDLDDVRADISNASASCGSAAFTSSLNATAFQFPSVDKARYLFAGSCEDFGDLIQTSICEFEDE